MARDDSVLDQLTQSYLFGGLPAEVLARRVLPLGRRAAYQKRDCVFSPAQRADRAGILLRGTVHILHLTPEGGYSLMSALTAPMALGIDLICTKTRMPPYHAVCATAAEALLFPESLFLQPGSLPEDCRTELLARMLTLLAQENMQKHYRLAILSRKGLRERIETYLGLQAQRRGCGEFRIPFTREELAAFLCVNRSALSHELSLMRQEGLIDFKRNAFIIKK